MDVKLINGKEGTKPAGLTVDNLPKSDSSDIESLIKSVPKGVISDVNYESQRKGGMVPQRQGILSYQTMNRVYEQNGIVRAVVDTKRRQLVKVKWKIDKKNKKKPAPNSSQEQVNDLFYHANENAEGYTELMLKLLKDVLVLDAGVMEKVRSGDGEVVELVALDGATMVPMIDKHLRVDGYTQKLYLEGKEEVVEFPPEDIVYIRANPTTQRVWGLSPIESLVVDIGADIYALNHNAMNFVSGNLMDNLLMMGRIGTEALGKLEKFFEDNRGKGNVLPILSDLDDGGAGVKHIKLRDTNRDMEFMAFSRWLFQRICACFQVDPSQVILLEPLATKAGVEGQQTVHEDKSLAPELAIVSGRFTEDICQEFHGNLQFEFIDRVKQKPIDEANTWSIRFRSGVPLNELRADANLEPLTVLTVKVNGEDVPLFDLPINPTTGAPYGFPADFRIEGVEMPKQTNVEPEQTPEDDEDATDEE